MPLIWGINKFATDTEISHEMAIVQFKYLIQNLEEKNEFQVSTLGRIKSRVIASAMNQSATTGIDTAGTVNQADDVPSASIAAGDSEQSGWRGFARFRNECRFK